MLELQGAYTALITPFKNDLIDENALRELVDRQIESGIDGLVACGTTGESATLSHSEKLRVIRIVAEQADGRVPVIAGSGNNNTLETIKLTQEVAEINGVEAALIVTPYYNKPNARGLFEHFEAVATRGELPVILYNVPGRTGVSLSIETIEQLSENRKIIAIKEASGNLAFDSEMLEKLKRANREHFVALSGDDFSTFPFCALGGKGCISVVSNILPAEMSELCHLTIEGELERAREIHYKIQPLARVLFQTTNPIPVKCAASLLGWCSNEFRLPLTPLDIDQLEPLRHVLEHLDLL